MPSVLWHCWLAVRKSIWPVKISDKGLVSSSIWSEVEIVCMWSSWCHCRPSPSSLASFKSRLVLPFCYRLTQVVLEKRPLNWCSSGSSDCYLYIIVISSIAAHNLQKHSYSVRAECIGLPCMHADFSAEFHCRRTSLVIHVWKFQQSWKRHS